MSDIFREVDEEVRRQNMEALWKKYGNLLITLAVLLVLAVGGWRYYQHRQEQAAEVSAEKFEAALELAKAGKTPEAESAFAALATEGTPGYKALAQLRAAAEVSKRDPAAAIKTYEALSADASLGAVLQDLAKLRAAMLLVDTISPDELVSRIGALSAPGKPWRNSARELLGLARFKAGDLKAASGYFEHVALDPETPPKMRQRAQLLLSMVRGGQVPVK